MIRPQAFVCMFLFAFSVAALEFPGTHPGLARCSTSGHGFVLENDIVRCEWKDLGANGFPRLTISDLQTNGKIVLTSGFLPVLQLSEADVVDLASLSLETIRTYELRPDSTWPRGELRRAGRAVHVTYHHADSGIGAKWSVELRDGANYLTQTLELTTEKDARIEQVTFLDAEMEGATQVGDVDGSVVMCGNVFVAVEHPLASNTVEGNHVRLRLERGNTLRPDRPWSFSTVIGVTPPGQLRRGFLYYIELRRARPHAPFLHYNSWYHLNIDRPDHRMTEEECVETVKFIGRELVKERNVKLDAFVWDDGWDDFNSLWGFHDGFPVGFKNLRELGKTYGASQGVWMSPWGGYGGPKEKRIAYGESHGFETNAGGFSMAGPEYGAAFRDVCLKMMAEHGVVFFKFDGMGAGNSTGAKGESADDIDAVLRLTETLRTENPELFISATVGTWASPFWTRYADSIWRQGGDTGFLGAGNTRQQWITYRDEFCHERVVKLGPLYPLNSLMLHGLCVGERENPGKMTRDEQSVSDEIWTFFASGTNLQELYISPHLLTERMWDEVAAAANWSRANSDVLVDTHWIGGDPGVGEVYGWASWRSGKGIIALRNPAEEARVFTFDLKRALELPDGEVGGYTLVSPKPNQRIATISADATEEIKVELQPFEVLVFEATR